MKLRENGFFPLVLGQDFFDCYKWSYIPGENIKTPFGEMYVEEEQSGGRAIDVNLCEQVYQANQELKKKGSKHKQLTKLHKYFGHASTDSLWRIIKNSSNKEGYSQEDIKQVCEDCGVCNLSKRKMFKKKTSLPRSTGFNQVVTMDLKCHNDGKYILWLVNDATRLIRGQVINDKTPDTIIDALEKTWIIGRGMGPGLPEKYFFCDNGGEFLNEKLLNLAHRAGITIKKTASYSPQMNGLNERNHGVADIIVEKLRRDSPTITLQAAVDQASWARNSQINAERGFSPFQLVYGRNPSLPGVSDATTGGLETMTHSEIVKAMFYRMENTRVMMMRAETDYRLKIAAKARLPTETNICFDIGDEITFRDGKEGVLHDGRIVGFEGPVALIRWGNCDRKVHKRDLLPRREIRQEDNSESESEEEEEEELITEITPTRRGPRRKRKPEIIPEISPFKIKKTRNTPDRRRQYSF